MNKINLIIWVIPLVVSSCLSSQGGDINSLLLYLLKDSSASQNEDSKTDKADKPKVNESKDFWSKLDLSWKKAVAWQIKSIDYNDLPKTLSSSQIQDALEMKELTYDCLQEKMGCWTKSAEKITDLTSVKYFTKLETLNLRANSIKTIPSEIEKLTKIKSINLSRNQIEKLPTFLNQLSSLETLDLYGNQIETISKNTFTQLDELEFLNLIQGSHRTPTNFLMYSWDESVKREIQSQVITTATIRFGDEITNGTRTK